MVDQISGEQVYGRFDRRDYHSLHVCVPVPGTVPSGLRANLPQQENRPFGYIIRTMGTATHSSTRGTIPYVETGNLLTSFV